MKIFIVSILFFFCTFQAIAENKWYWGEITQVNTLKRANGDGSFEVRINHPDLIANCKYNTIRFQAEDYGDERTASALSMALAAFMGGKQYGVVLELPQTLDFCYASPSASQGAGIK